MNDPSRKNKELLEEISVLKNRIQKLERSEAERKLAENALRESENKYRLLLESILDGVYVIDSNGHFTFVNDVMTRRSGHPREWFIGRHCLDVIRPEQREQARSYVEAGLRGETVPPHELMLAYERPTGEDLWVEIITNVIYENGRVVGILGVSRDITARKHAEQALRHSERRYRTLLENIKDGVCITGPDRTFIFVNDIIVERSGHPREWFRGRTALDLVKPELRGFVRSLGNKSMQGEKVPPFEVSYVNASGDELWMECHIASLYEDEEFAGFLTVNRDITERKRMEKELRKHRDHLEQLVAERAAALAESEKRYRELVDNALVGVYQTALTGEILYHNDYLVHMLGFDSVEEIKASKHPLRYKNPDDREPHLRILKEKGKLTNYETEFLTRDGEAINVLISASLSGNIISGMVMDITDRKKAEEELTERTEQLKESNIALKVLLDQRDRDRQDMEERFVSNVKHLVLPYLENLSGMSLSSRQETLVSIARTNLDQIVSPFLKNMHYQYSGFTPTELRVAGFLKDGRTVKEIAGILGISEAAVNSHRQHIRDKLGLKNRKVNLRAHLQSLGDMPRSIP